MAEYGTIWELKKRGLIDAIGVGVNEYAVCMEIMKEMDLDFILLGGRYTLLDQIATRELFPHSLNLVASAMQYTLKNNAVVSVLAGPENTEHVGRGVTRMGGYIPQEFRSELDKREFQINPGREAV